MRKLNLPDGSYAENVEVIGYSDISFHSMDRHTSTAISPTYLMELRGWLYST
jgi:hypothetical protein